MRLQIVYLTLQKNNNEKFTRHSYDRGIQDED